MLLEVVPGEYEVRLTNDRPTRHLAVLAVDGVNVIDGKDAGHDGQGWVLDAWSSVTVKGWLRSGAECARFVFSPEGESYAAGTGRGTQNTGVIGVAVFDEKVALWPVRVVERVVTVPVPYPVYPVWPMPAPVPQVPSMTWSSTAGSSSVPLGSVDVQCSTTGHAGEPVMDCNLDEMTQTIGTPVADMGTAYGRAEAFHTRTVDFIKATQAPAELLTLRYGLREKLTEWGVPVDTVAATAPSAFPASSGYAQPPVGWQG